MKFRFPILSAVAAIFCLCAFPSCSQEPSSRVEVLEKAAETLSLVDSKDAADSAADRVSALLASLEKFPETTGENLAAAQAAAGRFLAQGLRLNKERFFESEKLKKALGYTENTENTESVPANGQTAPAENVPAETPAENVPAETPAENA